MEKAPETAETGYTQEEIEKFRKIFRTMPSYEESISTKDVVHYLTSINYIKSMETYQQYVDYGDSHFGGRYELTQILNYIGNGHESRILLKQYLQDFEVNNDGFVKREEFEFVMKTMQLHDSKLKNISYEKFLTEVVTNKDGKISVSDCDEWIKNYVL